MGKWWQPITLYRNTKSQLCILLMYSMWYHLTVCLTIVNLNNDFYNFSLLLFFALLRHVSFVRQNTRKFNYELVSMKSDYGLQKWFIYFKRDWSTINCTVKSTLQIDNVICVHNIYTIWKCVCVTAWVNANTKSWIFGYKYENSKADFIFSME